MSNREEQELTLRLIRLFGVAGCIAELKKTKLTRKGQVVLEMVERLYEKGMLREKS